jgi:hypothetical protein
MMSWGAGDVDGDGSSNGSPVKLNRSGEIERSKLEDKLGVCDIDSVGVLMVDDATERAVKRPLVLGCVCQLRLGTCTETCDTQGRMKL